MAQALAAMSTLQFPIVSTSIHGSSQIPDSRQNQTPPCPSCVPLLIDVAAPTSLRTLAFSSSQLSGSTPLAHRSVQSSRSTRFPSRLVVRAESSPEGAGGEPSGFGLGGPGTWFGFGPRQERNVGRLGMMGFASALVMEVVTGKGVLGQLGMDPSSVKFPLLAGIAFLFIAGLLGGYTVVNNPPDLAKAPANEGAGLPRDPLKTFDAKTVDPLTMYSRGGVVEREGGQRGREPYVSDLDLPKKK